MRDTHTWRLAHKTERGDAASIVTPTLNRG
jgi:hypothetical protein